MQCRPKYSRTIIVGIQHHQKRCLGMTLKSRKSECSFELAFTDQL